MLDDQTAAAVALGGGLGPLMARFASVLDEVSKGERWMWGRLVALEVSLAASDPASTGWHLGRASLMNIPPDRASIRQVLEDFAILDGHLNAQTRWNKGLSDLTRLNFIHAVIDELEERAAPSNGTVH